MATIKALIEKQMEVDIRQTNQHMKVKRQQEEVRITKKPRIKVEVEDLRTEIGSDGEEIIVLD